MAYHTAVLKRADDDGIPVGAAPFRVMTDIDQYNKSGGLKKELNDTIMNMQMVNLMSARQINAIIALAKLQCYEIKESQILDLCRTIEANDYNLNGTRSMISHPFSVERWRTRLFIITISM